MVFYVYAPSEKRNKAGISVLHNLVKELRQHHCEAWVISHSFNAFQANRDLELNMRVLMRHYRRKLTPIVIYPESIPRNLLNNSENFWYLLSMPHELLSNNSNLISNPRTFAYSRNLSQIWKSNGPVVHISTIDFKELDSFSNSFKYGKPLVYGGKYRDLHGGTIPKELSYFEILERSISDSLDRKTFLKKIAGASVLYCFENTTVALESIMLGTPVVFVPNSKFRNFILFDEFGGAGISMYGSPDMAVMDRESVAVARFRYQQYCNANLDRSLFISWMQTKISGSGKSINRTMSLNVFFLSRRLRWVTHKMFMCFSYVSARLKR